MNCKSRRSNSYQAWNYIVKDHDAAKNGVGSAKVNMMANKVIGNNTSQEQCRIFNSPRPDPCEDDQVPEHTAGLCIAADGTSFGVAHFLGCAYIS